MKQRPIMLAAALALVMSLLPGYYRRALAPAYVLAQPVPTSEVAALTVKSWQLAGSPGRPDLRDQEVCGSHVWDVGGDYLVPLLWRDADGRWRSKGFVSVNGPTGRVGSTLIVGYRESDLHAAECRPMQPAAVAAWRRARGHAQTPRDP